MSKQALVVVADTHVNSKFGVCPPGQLDSDGALIERNTAQKWLWQTWNQWLKELDDITKGYHVTLVLNGDIMEADSKQRSWQIMDRNPATIKKLAFALFEPLIESADQTLVLRGTEAHTGKSAWLEELFAADIGAIPNKNAGTASWWHFRGMFSRVKFDIAHHANMGSLPWTYVNAPAKLAVETTMYYAEWEEKPPNVVVRSHQHRFADSGKSLPVRAVFTPCWQFKTAFMHRIGKSNAMPHIGSTVFLCDKGEYTIKDMRYKPKRGPVWVNNVPTPV